MVTEEQVIEKLRTVEDPEIKFNIYDLGLIYGVEIDSENNVIIRMTLTSPGCPYGAALMSDAKTSVEKIEEVKSATVDLVWEPIWGLEQISDEAKDHLGML